MKKMFLASSFTSVSTLFADFENNLKGKTVTVIPTASRVERVNFYVWTGKRALKKLGLSVDVLEISTSSIDKIERKIKENDFIYITGGNTFFLLQELRRTGADKIIIDEVNAGKTYIGESAGSIVTSTNIEYIKEMDSIKKAPSLADYNSLGLIDFHPVPHFNNVPFKKSAQKIIDNYSSSMKLLPFSNNQAITIENGKVTLK
ncbi:MAG: peptidase E [Aminipila sp.]